MPNSPPHLDRRSEDLGNIVEFGHVNLRVPDQQLAMIFYVMGLGLTRDPYLLTGVDNAWINVGSSQFHLPVGPAQILRGTIGLVMPDLDALRERLAAVRLRLSGTRFAYVAEAVHVDVICPWGNRIRVHAPDAKRFGRILLGMPYVQIDVAAGTTEGIARFYAEVIGALANCGTDDGAACVRVCAGPNESLVFRETRQALAPYDGHHLQVTLADFSGVHRRLLERSLISEESNQSQYRFENIIDLDSAAVLVTLEHEVRSLRHPMYGRALVNRNPGITANAYVSDHEAAPWRMPPS